MKKVLISLVAVLGVFVADCTAKEAIVCKSIYYDATKPEEAKKINPYSTEIKCFGKFSPFDKEEGGKISFDKLYTYGWHFVGQFDGNGEGAPHLLVFEK